MGATVIQAANWRLVAFGELGLLLIASIGMVILGAQPKAVPHLVLVDKLGAATRTVILLSSLLPLSVACAGKQPPPRYVRAQVVKEEPPKPAIVEVARPVPIPGQLKRLAPAAAPGRRAAAAKLRPSEVIREANRKATEGPSPDDYYNAIMTYDFTPGTLYQIYTAPQKLTDIQLRPGERLVGKPATGDNIRWVLARGPEHAAAQERLPHP